MIYTYDSTMPGAPVISGSAGSLRTTLKACLVDGWGAGAVASLTVTNGVASATFANGHPYRVGSVALLAGAAGAGLNGERSVLSVAADRITFAAPDAAAGADAGNITSRLAPAGYRELFAGQLTNVIALQAKALEATGCVLRVDDTGGSNARVRAYEGMTDIATGAGPTPMESQVAGGLWWPKSSSGDSTARAWWMVADARGFYFAIAPAGSDRFTVLYAGDIASLRSGDAYGYLLTGNASDQAGSSGVPDGCCGYSSRTARTGAYLVRSHTGIGQAIAAQRLGAHHNGTASDVYAGAFGYSVGGYPNPANNGLITAPLELASMGIRGTLPGLHHPAQDLVAAFSSGAVVEGTDDLAGHRLLAIRVAPPTGGASGGTVFIDVTDWGR